MSNKICHDEANVSPLQSLDYSTLQREIERHAKDEKEAFDPSGPRVLPVPVMEDFPDGGLRAWLVVFGVSPVFNIYTSLMEARKSRGYWWLSQGEGGLHDLYFVIAKSMLNLSSFGYVNTWGVGVLASIRSGLCLI
jgi:hypothetical protein